MPQHTDVANTDREDGFTEHRVWCEDRMASGFYLTRVTETHVIVENLRCAVSAFGFYRWSLRTSTAMDAAARRAHKGARYVSGSETVDGYTDPAKDVWTRVYALPSV